MSIKGSPYARFRRAVETGSALLATAAAHELPQLGLTDALRLCLVYAREDPGRFDRAIVRWHARLCLDAGGLDRPTAQTALAAASSLPGPCGAEGAIVVDGEGEPTRVPAFDVDVVDTTGCGDAFSAGFVVGLGLGRSPQDAAVLGCASAALVAGGLGSDHGDFDLHAADAFAAATPARTP